MRRNLVCGQVCACVRRELGVVSDHDYWLRGVLGLRLEVLVVQDDQRNVRYEVVKNELQGEARAL